jgi:hypothetical protein
MPICLLKIFCATLHLPFKVLKTSRSTVIKRQDKMKTTTPEAYSLTVIVTLLKLASAQTINRGDYPAGFTPAPPVELWSKALLKGANIPNLPLRAAGQASDISQDVMACPGANSWALTLDDGPGPYTDANALGPLQSNRMKATFFVTGQQAVQYPDLIRKMHQQGHQVRRRVFTQESYN